LIDRRAMIAGCEPILRRLGASCSPLDRVNTLSTAQRQLVEIARALHANARILVLDEPTAALSSRETERLFELVGALKRERIAIVYISHRMDEVIELSDRVSVLRDGRCAGHLDRAELSAATLVQMMVGRDISGFYSKDRSKSAISKDVMLRVRNLGDRALVRNCSFDARAGEILALSGLVGAGRTELAQLIYGVRPARDGTITLRNRPVAIRSPRDAIDAGIAYLTEDRKELGVLLDMDVHENINLIRFAADAGFFGILDRRRARQRTRDAIQALSIRVRDPHVAVGTLSGGNQQKVLLARLLQTRPQVVILDEPTRGVDIGAKSEIYRMIEQLAAHGACVLMISSDLPEIVGIADRVLVMREGTIAGEVSGMTGMVITQEAIMRIAAVPGAAG